MSHDLLRLAVQAMNDVDDNKPGPRAIMGLPALARFAELVQAQPSQPATVARKALVEACFAIEGLIAWDSQRNFPVPYKVRDPLHEALNLVRDALKAAPSAAQPGGADGGSHG